MRSVRCQSRGAGHVQPLQLAGHPQTALIKVDHWLHHAQLRFDLRIRRPDRLCHLLGGRYEPLHAVGPLADRIVAYARIDGERSVVVTEPRFVSGMMNDDSWPIGEEAWGGTTLVVPQELAVRTFRNFVTGEDVEPTSVARILRSCPVGLLCSRDPM